MENVDSVENSPEIQRLSEAREQLRWIRKTYQSSDLKREIRLLQEVSRLQPLPSDLRVSLLKELEKRKVVQDILVEEIAE